MKILVHITFFYQKSDLKFLEKIIKSYENFECKVDIQVNTNKNFSNEVISSYKNGEIKIKKLNLNLYSFLKNRKYFYTWLSYYQLLNTNKKYDFYIYTEHDIEFKYENFKYYKNEKANLNKKYNIGFIRTETLNDELFCVDVKNKNFKTIYLMNGKKYIETNFLYSAIWILDHHSFNNFKKMKESNLIYLFIKNKRISDKLQKFTNNQFLLILLYFYKNKKGNGIRELAAHGPNYPFANLFDEILIPIINGEIHKNSKIKHLSNKYVLGNDSGISKIKFEDLTINN